MAAVPVQRVIATESSDRDRSRKLLRLLEYATNAGAEALSDTLSVLLLSLMGEFTATGGAVLMRDDGGGLRVMATRGSVQARSGAVGNQAVSDDVTLNALGLELVVPMVHRDQTLGYLGLANRIVGTYRADDRELVRMVAGIAATTIQNHELHAELRSVNRVLERRVFDLHTVFNVSAELNGGHEPESIFRAVGQTVMAHLLVSRCVVVMEEDGRPKLRFSRGVRLSANEQESLEALDFHPPLALASTHSGDRPRPPFAAALAATGIDELIPLHGGETVRGFLGIGGQQKRRTLGREDTAFLQTLGQQAITALDNLRLHVDRARRMQLERELMIARQIQRTLLPAELPGVAGYELAVLSEPCYEVGGDYYDLLPLKEGVLVAIGDVSGKSVPAALLMSVVQATIRSLAGRPGESPATLVHALNHHLIKSTQPNKFVSLFLAWLEPASGRLEYTNAGHNPPLVARRDGTFEKLVSGGPVLGILDDATFVQANVTLQPGDLLFLYTDGVTEAMDCGDNEFGDARLESVVRQARTGSADGVLQRVTAAVAEHTNGVATSDDVTAVAIKREEA